MLGGNIPGKTKVASIALYDEVQKLNYDTAHLYAFILLVISFLMLLLITLIQRKIEREI
jgi:molybdate transport system permease protein